MDASFFNFDGKIKNFDMLLKELMEMLEEAAPFSLQESYDNSGLQVGSPSASINSGLVCLDITPEVIAEAREKSCDLVISHHPLIFKGLKKITGQHFTEEVIIEAIKHDIAIVSVHTNLDNMLTGVNQMLCKKLGMKNLQVLEQQSGLLKKLVVFCPNDHAEKVRGAIFKEGAGHIGDYDCCSYNIEGKGSFRAGDQANPFVGNLKELHFEPEIRIETIYPAFLEKKILNAMHASHPYEEVAYDIYPLENSFDRVGSGMIGELEEPLFARDFLDLLKNRLKVPVIRHSELTSQPIDKVAVCGGSGSFLLDKAISSGAKAFVTADVKYHQFFDARKNILLADAGHFETEQFTVNLLYDVVNKKISNFALQISEVNTNPVHYY